MRGLNSETHGLSVYVDEKPAPILTYIFPPIKQHCNVCGRSDIKFQEKRRIIALNQFINEPRPAKLLASHPPMHHPHTNQPTDWSTADQPTSSMQLINRSLRQSARRIIHKAHSQMESQLVSQSVSLSINKSLPSHVRR